MFFVFSFFHFLCNLRISTELLSIPKNEIFNNLHYVFFFSLKELNFSLIIQFQSFLFLTLTPVETQMLPLEERRLNLYVK